MRHDEISFRQVAKQNLLCNTGNSFPPGNWQEMNMSQQVINRLFTGLESKCKSGQQIVSCGCLLLATGLVSSGEYLLLCGPLELSGRPFMVWFEKFHLDVHRYCI